jgi:DNA-binding NarL/FixJ family response regulator
MAIDRGQPEPPSPRRAIRLVPAHTGRGATLLVADCEFLFAELLTRFLRRRHAVSQPTSNLRRFEEALRSTRPTLALLDLALGGVDGFAMLNKLVQQYTETLFLVMSAHHQSAYAARAVVAGARGYLVRSCTPEELAEAIQLILAGGIYVPDESRLSPSPRLGGPGAFLTEQQQRVLNELRIGGTQREVASRLGLAVSTLEKHVRTLKRKSKVDDTRKWVRWASHEGDETGQPIPASTYIPESSRR